MSTASPFWLVMRVTSNPEPEETGGKIRWPARGEPMRAWCCCCCWCILTAGENSGGCGAGGKLCAWNYRMHRWKIPVKNCRKVRFVYLNLTSKHKGRTGTIEWRRRLFGRRGQEVGKVWLWHELVVAKMTATSGTAATSGPKMVVLFWIRLSSSGARSCRALWKELWR